MSRPFLLLHTVIGPSLAGAFVVTALLHGMADATPLHLAAVAGFAAGLPVALYLTRPLAD